MTERYWRDRAPRLVPGGFSGIVPRCYSCEVAYVADDGQVLFRGLAAGTAAAVDEGWWRPNADRPRVLLCPECVLAADRGAAEQHIISSIERAKPVVGTSDWERFKDGLLIALCQHMAATGQQGKCVEFVEAAAVEASS